MESFKKRWNITSNWQMLVIFVVFAVTGSTAALIAKPILAFFGITKETISLWLYFPLYIIIILPFYQVLLVTFGFLFGQFNFFWAFEKKMLRSMKLGFIADYLDSFSKK
jgi:hypothetical protein